MKRLLKLDWDALAGIIAAVAALILHLLHVIDEGVLLALALVLLALLLIRDLRRESEAEQALACAEDRSQCLEDRIGSRASSSRAVWS